MDYSSPARTCFRCSGVDRGPAHRRAAAVIAGGGFIMLGNVMLAFGVTQVFFMDSRRSLGRGIAQANVSAWSRILSGGRLETRCGFSCSTWASMSVRFSGRCSCRCALRTSGGMRAFALPAAGMLVGC